MTEPSSADVRAWARANGHFVSDRGRLSSSVLAAYAAAHPDEEADEQPAPARAAAPRRPLVRAPRPSPEPDPQPEPYPSTGPAASGTPEPAAWPQSPPPSPPDAPTRWQSPPPPDAAARWQSPPAAYGAAEPGAAPAWHGAPPPPGAPPPQRGAPPPAWGSYPPQPAKTSNGFSIAALVLGIIPILAGILGITFGIIALRRIRQGKDTGRGMAIAGIVLGTCWLVFIAVIVTVGVTSGPDRASDGSVSGKGSVAVSSLRTGDCPSALPDRTARTLTLVPCSEPHRAEVYATFPISGSDYPGEAEVTRFADGGCAERLSAYVGKAKEDSFDVYYLYPTADSWRLDDHDVDCLITAPGGATLPGGSAKAP